MEQKCATLAPSAGRGLVVKLARRIRIKRKIELIIPPEFKPGLTQHVVAKLCCWMTLRKICRMRGDLVGYNPVLNVLFIGKTEMFPSG